MTPEKLRELPIDEFEDYLNALVRGPDATAETLSEAWAELQIRQARLEAAMYEEGAARGMTREQIDELKQCVRRSLGVHEDEL